MTKFFMKPHFTAGATAVLAVTAATVGVVEGLLTNPVANTAKNAGTLLPPRTFVTKDIKTPDPIPEAGQKEALELMQTGRLYRYNVQPGQDSVVSKCEKEIVGYTGHKYCVGLNSCGSALMLLLKTSGLEPGGKVLSNAFTFGAVPSAIEHANGKAVYVESTVDHVMDVSDLEKKLVAHPDCKHVMISHMRGKLADMSAVKALCDEHDAILLEDCAHSLGATWNGVHSGHMGVAAAISAQSYKMINSGEGGFLLTDDPEIAAQAAVYAGAYEALHAKHATVPSAEHFKGKPESVPNYSIRMSNLAAAVIRPQIETLQDRVEKYDERYMMVAKMLEDRVGDHMYLPRETPGATTVRDSIQFNLDPTKFDEGKTNEFLRECHDHGLPVELFGAKSNARNFVNWGFAPASEPLPQTAAMLSTACDCRMPLMWDDEDFVDLANVIAESVEFVLGLPAAAKNAT